MAEKLDTKNVIQAMTTRKERADYTTTLNKLNELRWQNNKKRVYESRLIRRLMIKLTAKPHEVLDFLNYDDVD